MVVQPLPNTSLCWLCIFPCYAKKPCWNAESEYEFQLCTAYCKTIPSVANLNATRPAPSILLLRSHYCSISKSAVARGAVELKPLVGESFNNPPPLSLICSFYLTAKGTGIPPVLILCSTLIGQAISRLCVVLLKTFQNCFPFETLPFAGYKEYQYTGKSTGITCNGFIGKIIYFSIAGICDSSNFISVIDLSWWISTLIYYM